MYRLNLEFSHTSYEIIDKENCKIGYRDAQENLSFFLANGFIISKNRIN
jgi:hypothetical protein